MINMTNLSGVLKTLYSKKKLENIGLNKHPLLEMLKKDTSASGDYIKQPVIYGNIAGATATFADAYSNASNTSAKVAGFLLETVDLFNVAYINDKTIQASRNDEGAFIKVVKLAVETMVDGAKGLGALQLYRSGYGELGQVSSPGASTTLTLVDPRDALNFVVDQVLVFSSAVSSAVLRDSGASLTITGVNYNAGTLTMSGNVNTISGISDGDYIFVKGTRQNSATPARICIAGLEAWCPATAPSSSDSFFGVNRSTNSLLYGSSLDASNMPIEEALIKAAGLVQSVRGELTHYFINMNKYQELINALGAKVQYVNIYDAKGAPVGFQAVQVMFGKKPIMVVPDADCPENRVFGINLPMFTLWSMGEAFSIYDRDGNTMLRLTNDNALELRSVTYWQLGCQAPSNICNIQV